ncbi:DNA mismatch repair protein MutL [Gymnopus androsaceus JB14]|uniref:DNA mismatch repair protein MutL n=1 Tax=Gymnopus androsaceus JB14 TaxID=1447944 RepID=A0A6A4GZY6_9AGAR|nr:DNA mismatch repair protein MutL [Gymnopus androsaceus JB14]
MEPVYEPPAPAPIRRLQESLINRIAAGEIIHRPASALKELLENSLDAGATSIRVTVKDGGLKYLQIQDNGCGIRKSDLPILAERFTTSKLSTFSDLSRLTTYGFRGEALASISHVAHLSVTTKTRTTTCAYKAHYSDGKLVPAQPGQTEEPKPCAGNDGTSITIENLFFNTPTRLAALRNTSEEYSRILDVMNKYAIHNPSVAFTCKKAGSASPDLSTPSGSSTKHAIKIIYGRTIEKDLLETRVKEDSKKTEESWSADIHFTNANYQAKKMMFLLFINSRLVESQRIKRALENVYTGILPKGASPFIYLSLKIDPRSVDVNVHPTKKEVHFLNEEEITTRICDVVQEKIAEKSHSRVFEYQTLLTGGIVESSGQKSDKKRKDAPAEIHSADKGDQEEGAASGSGRRKYSMFPVVNPSQIGDSSADPNLSQSFSRYREVKESECFLTSVIGLRKRLEKGKHKLLTEILEKHIFVGIVDMDLCLSLVQYSTKLYLVNHGALAEELFYQLGLRQFGDFSRLKLEPSPSLHDLIGIAVDEEEISEETTLSKSEIVDRIVKLLREGPRRSMLAEYFSLKISEDGLVQSLPLLLRDYTPNLDKLPLFLMRLGTQVNWASETECFETFLRELAYFYVPGPMLDAQASVDLEQEKEEEETAGARAERWQIQHILFPAMRRYLAAPKSLLDVDVVQVASLPDLYKVFERC